MAFNDREYHVRREREHRSQAAIALTERAKLVHLAMAEQHATRAKDL